MEQGRGIPSAKERVDRLKETIQILRLMLNNDVTNFDGNFWKLKNAINVPLPTQKNMRISLGGNKDRKIKISAKYADGLNVGDLSIRRAREVIDKLKPELEKNNKTIDNFLISGFGYVKISKNEQEYEEVIKSYSQKFEVSIDILKKNTMIGTPEILVEKFHTLEDLGEKLFVLDLQSDATFQEIMEAYEKFDDSIRPYLR